MFSMLSLENIWFDGKTVFLVRSRRLCILLKLEKKVF